MILEGAEWYFSDAARKMAYHHTELARRVMVTLLNVAGGHTPPNGGVRFQGPKAIRGLRERICQEIVGTPEIEELPTAIPTKSTPWGVKWEGPDDPWGNYKFRVPRKVGKQKIKYVNPDTILKDRYFRKQGQVVRAYNIIPRSGLNWVRAGDLRSAVKKRQKRAGSLLGAWYDCAVKLGSSTAGRRYNYTERPRRGRVEFYVLNGKFTIDAFTDWYGLVVGRTFEPYFDSFIKRAAGKAVRNTENWFLKQLFG